MKRNFDQELVDQDGRPMVKRVFKVDAKGLPVLEDVNGQKVQAFDRHEPVTMRAHCIDALCGRYQGEEKAPWDQVKKRGDLLQRLMVTPHGEEIEVDSSEIQLLKDVLERAMTTHLVMYRIGTMLDTDPPKEEAKSE